MVRFLGHASTFFLKRGLRAQGSVELLILLAASLGVLTVFMGLTTQEIKDLTGEKVKADARTSVNDLASAADSVYFQGPGAKVKVFVKIPSGFEENYSFVKNYTINMRVKGSDIFATTRAPLIGTLPNSTRSVWVEARSDGNVTIG